MNMLTRTLMIAAALALGGCSTMNPQVAPVAASTQAVRDAEGNIAGYKQMLRDEKTGEVVAQVKMFTPMRNDAGELVGYEEQSGEGAIIRDLNGRRVGTRFSDLRSRQTNSKNKGITFIMGSLEPRTALAQNAQTQVLASALTSRDLRAVQ
jgi:hypothetical protein